MIFAYSCNNKCKGIDCGNHGRCETEDCVCLNGYYGEKCEFSFNGEFKANGKETCQNKGVSDISEFPVMVKSLPNNSKDRILVWGQDEITLNMDNLKITIKEQTIGANQYLGSGSYSQDGSFKLKLMQAPVNAFDACDFDVICVRVVD